MTAPDYFREVERAFVALRGGPGFLAPADWQVVADWERRGIPLEAALAGIRAALSNRAAVSPRLPLARCAPAVDRAFAALRLRSAGSAHAPDRGRVAERLAALVRTLAEWKSSVSGGAAAVAAAGERVAALAGEAPREVERRLAAIERELLDTLEAILGPADRERIATEAARALAAHRARMPAAAYRDALAAAIRRRVRRKLRVPALTLDEPS